MSNYNITNDQLDIAKRFFQDSSVEILTSVSTKINQEQPNFTAVLLALEKFGLSRIVVEDLLESIFVIYYIQTVLNKKHIPAISSGQVFKNVAWFGQFIEYYNEEKKSFSADLSEIKFLRDNIVLNFAANTLRNLFGGVTNIPKEVIFSYFALLKGIEMGAEKQ